MARPGRADGRGPGFEGQLQDICPQGAFVATTASFAVDTCARLEVELDDGLLDVKVLIAWRRGPGTPLPPGVGLRFLELTPSERTRLAHHLDLISAQAP